MTVGEYNARIRSKDKYLDSCIIIEGEINEMNGRIRTVINETEFIEKGLKNKEINKSLYKAMELTQLGWKCKLSYGDTALFIYTSENPPAGCW
jgi:hypothetical protein